MSVEIVLATRNRHKLRELTEILQGMEIMLLGIDAFPDCPEVEEDGKTFAENALKKARFVAEHTGRITMADDSGLEVDFLGGAPGIYSARYAGVQGNDLLNNEKLLNELKGVPEKKRGAQFHCVIAIVAPDGRQHVAEGICRGTVISQPKGAKGFGYDPIFFYEPFGLTFSEMGAEQKNSISHRSLAIQELKKTLPAFLSL